MSVTPDTSTIAESQELKDVRRLIDLSDTPLWLVRGSGEIIAASLASRYVLPMERRHLEVMRIKDLVIEADHVALDQLLSGGSYKQQDNSLDVTVQLPTGSLHPVNLVAQPAGSLYSKDPMSMLIRLSSNEADAKKSGIGSPDRLRELNAVLLALARSDAFYDGRVQEGYELITWASTIMLSCDRAEIWLIDENTDMLACRDRFLEADQRHEVPGAAVPLKLLKHYLRDLERTRHWIHDGDRKNQDHREMVDLFGLKYWPRVLDTPIRTAGKMRGILRTLRRDDGLAWSLDEQAFAGSLSDLLVQAIEVKQRIEAQSQLTKLNKELDRRAARYAELNALLLMLTRSEAIYRGDLDAAFQLVSWAATIMLDADEAGIWLLDPRSGSVSCHDYYSANTGAHTIQGKTSSLTDSAYLSRLDSRHSLTNSELDRESISNPWIDDEKEGIKAFLDAAVRVNGRVAGILHHRSNDPDREWSMEERAFATSLAELLTFAHEAHDRRTAQDELESINAQLEYMVADRTRALSLANEELREKNRTVQMELALAARLQRSLLPKLDRKRPGMSVTARYLPMGEISGDFYDVIILPNGRTGFWVADAVGHGVPAALMTTLAKLAFGSAKELAHTPGEILSHVAKELSDVIESDDFWIGRVYSSFTAFMGIIGPKGKLTFSNASHQSALVLRAETGEIEKVKGHPNPSISVKISADDEKIKFKEGKEKLKAKDRLVLYTDGIIEARNKNGKFYGRKRFHQKLTETMSMDIDAQADNILGEVLGFVGTADRNDDITLFILEMEPEHFTLPDPDDE